MVCNHVLEHVSDDRKAMREFFRILRPGGWALLQSPVDHRRPDTFEDPTVTDPRERKRVFGQYDHVRIYGRDYVRRLEETGFSVTLDTFVRELPESEVRRLGLDRDEEIYFCRKAGTASPPAAEPRAGALGAGRPGPCDHPAHMVPVTAQPDHRQPADRAEPGPGGLPQGPTRSRARPPAGCA